MARAANSTKIQQLSKVENLVLTSNNTNRVYYIWHYHQGYYFYPGHPVIRSPVKLHFFGVTKFFPHTCLSLVLSISSTFYFHFHSTPLASSTPATNQHPVGTLPTSHMPHTTQANFLSMSQVSSHCNLNPGISPCCFMGLYRTFRDNNGLGIKRRAAFDSLNVHYIYSAWPARNIALLYNM